MFGWKHVTYRVFRRNCVFSQFTPTVTPIGWLFFVQPIAEGEVANIREFLEKNTIFDIFIKLKNLTKLSL